MIEQGINAIVKLAQQSQTPFLVEKASTARELVYLVGNEGVAFDVPHPPRKHTAKSLEDLVELANRFAKEPTGTPVVFFNEKQIVLVIDDDLHRVDTVTLDLELSDIFKVIMELKKDGGWFQQGDFIRLLRVKLAGTLADHQLLDKVRKFVWIGTQKTEQVKGKTSSLAQFEGRPDATTPDELPDDVILAVPVFKTLGRNDRHPLKCAVDTDPGHTAFQLLPMPDEIEGAYHEAMFQIRKELVENLEAVPCYYGAP